MNVWWLFLLGLADASDQLDKLVQFAHGNGPNPAGGHARPAQESVQPPVRAAPQAPLRSTFQGTPVGNRFQQAPSTPRRRTGPAPRPLSQPPPPIPFSDYADPDLRVVSLSTGNQQPAFARPVASVPPAQSTSHSFRLPGGSVQVGGAPIQSKQRRPTTRPAPLSEVYPPIHRATDIPNVLDDIDPSSAASLVEPLDAMSHNLLPGHIPRPVAVPNSMLPVIGVIAQQHRPRLPTASQQRPSVLGLEAVENEYDRFASNTFPDNRGEVVRSQQEDGFHRPVQSPEQSFLQADEAHRLALEKHNLYVEQVKSLQQQPSQNLHQHRQPNVFTQQQQRPQAQQFLPQSQHRFQLQRNAAPVLTNQIPNSHFTIPGGVSHRKYTEELKLAQDALRALG